MEPFSITCTTCKSRLKVKSLAAVGQLVKCPKCGGMVLVKVPEEKKPGDSASLKAETAPAIQKPTRPADAQDTVGENQDFDEVEALLATAAPKTPPPAAKTSVREKPARSTASRFAEGEPASAPSNGSHAKEHPAANQTPKSREDAPPVPGSEVVPLPSADWTSPRPWKYWLFLAVAILLGVALACGVVMLSLSFFQDGSVIALTPASNSELPASVQQSPATPATSVQEQPAKSPKATGPAEVSPQKVATPAEKGKSEPAKTAAPPDALPEGDPLGLTKKPGAETKASPPAATKDPLGKFQHLLNDPGEDPTAPAPTARAETPRAKPVEEPSETPARPALPRPPARAINMAARLNDPLPGIEAKEVPLADFLQAMQEFSTIPITLEPDTLPFFRQSPETPVHFDGENLKFGPALTAALTPLGLEMVVEEDQIVVRRPELVWNKEAREYRMDVVGYDVKDLTHEDEKQAAELAEKMMALIAPGSWGDDDEDENVCTITPGKETFRVRHRLSTRMQLALLCEKLRVARGLTPKAAKALDAELFRLSTRTEKAAPRLGAPVSVTFNRPTSLVKIAQKLSAVGKMRVLIDWQSIASSGWNPDAEATLVADKKPFSEALTALLGPMDLAYRIVDGRTIQIVSQQLLAERLEVELYPAQDLAASQEQIEPLLARIRSALAERGEGGEGDLAGQFWIDPESKCLVALLSQPKHQLLTRLLAEWRTKETN